VGFPQLFKETPRAVPDRLFYIQSILHAINNTKLLRALCSAVLENICIHWIQQEKTMLDLLLGNCQLQLTKVKLLLVNSLDQCYFDVNLHNRNLSP
jgi:hypothetical protein